MAQPLQQCGAYPGVVREQAEWVDHDSLSRRMLTVPLVTTIGENVLLLVGDNKVPRFPQISYVSAGFPEELLPEGPVRSLYTDGKYNRPQHEIELEARRLMRAGKRTAIDVGIRFLECWKAYSDDLRPKKRNLVGVQALVSPGVTTEIKQLPFHVSLPIKPDRLTLTRQYKELHSLHDEEPFIVGEIPTQLEKLGNLIADLKAAGQKPNYLVDIVQYLEQLQDLPAEREQEHAAHS